MKSFIKRKSPLTIKRPSPSESFTTLRGSATDGEDWWIGWLRRFLKGEGQTCWFFLLQYVFHGGVFTIQEPRQASFLPKKREEYLCSSILVCWRCVKARVAFYQFRGRVGDQGRSEWWHLDQIFKYFHHLLLHFFWICTSSFVHIYVTLYVSICNNGSGSAFCFFT